MSASVEASTTITPDEPAGTSVKDEAAEPITYTRLPSGDTAMDGSMKNLAAAAGASHLPRPWATRSNRLGATDA